MLKLDTEVVINQRPKWKPSMTSCLVSLISVLFTQFTLSLLPLLLPTSHFIILLLPLSALLLVIVVGLGRFCKKVAGVRASAPAFVFFSIFFIWAVYICVVRQGTSSLLDFVINVEIIMLILGLCRIILLDPGFVAHYSPRQDLTFQNSLDEAEAHIEELEVSTSVVHQGSLAEDTSMRHKRVRYCKHCKNYVLGFDHHCPAFGNCVGQRNHALFLVLLVGFAMSEASYVVSACQFTAKSQTSKEDEGKVLASSSLVLGSMLFCLIQVLWQVVFIIWHIYCASFNIKTDEWINWREYPEFQIEVIPHPGEPETSIQFINPYDKGILRNLKEFFSTKG